MTDMPKDEINNNEPVQGITVQVTLLADEPTHDGSSAGTRRASLALYLHDRRLADAPATRVSTATCDIVSGDTTATVVLPIDADSCKSMAATMVQPAWYVALDMAQTVGLTYATGPVFDVSPANVVTLALRPTSLP